MVGQHLLSPGRFIFGVMPRHSVGRPASVLGSQGRTGTCCSDWYAPKSVLITSQSHNSAYCISTPQREAWAHSLSTYFMVQVPIMIYIHPHTHTHIHVSYICSNTFMYIYVYVCIYIDTYTYMHINIYVSTHIYDHIISIISIYLNNICSSLCTFML